MVCKHCSKENSDEAVFCNGCGTKLDTNPSSVVNETSVLGDDNNPNYIPPQAQQYVPPQQQYIPPQSQYVPPQQQYIPPQSQQYVPPQQQYNVTPVIPAEYRPLSPWAYFGYQILFAIPLIGFILLLVFALGGASNKNLKNFARSYFCIFLILLILVVLLAITGGLSVLSFRI